MRNGQKPRRLLALLLLAALLCCVIPSGADDPSYYSEWVQAPTRSGSFNLNSLLSAVTLMDTNGNVLATSSPWTIQPNASYKIKFEFSETNGDQTRQFPDDDTPMVYTLPAGLSLGDQDLSGTVEIDMGETGKAHASLTYSASAGTLTFVWVTDEPGFVDLKGMGNAEFDVTFTVIFTGEESSIEFSDSLTVSFTDYHLATIEKTGEYDKENGKINYEVTITNVGVSRNVTVTDVLSGTVLNYHEGDTVAWTNTNGSSGSHTITAAEAADGELEIAIGDLQDGEIVTLRYSSDIDYARMDNEVDNIYDHTSRYVSTEEETKNTATVSADGQADLRASWHTLDIVTQTLRKTATISEGPDSNTRIIHWTLNVNEDVATSLAGKVIQDKLSASTSDRTSFNRDTPLLINVYDAEGALVGTRSIDWNNPPDNFTFTDSATTANQDQWAYTVPVGDGRYHYVITYDTLVDVSDLSSDPNVQNYLEIVNQNGVWSGATVPAGEAKFTYSKEVDTSVEETNGKGWTEDYIYWKVTLNVPAVGYSNPVFLDDYLPLVRYNNAYLYDELDTEYDVSVDGLLEGESYVMAETQSGADKIIRFYFYRDENHESPGFQASSGNRTVTLTFRTINNQTWMDVYPDWRAYSDYSYHQNRVRLNTNGSYGGWMKARATPYKIRPVKNGTYVTTVDVGGVSYPVYRFTVDFQGVKDILSQDTMLSVDGVHYQKYFTAIESFDNTALRMLDVENEADYAILESIGADMARVNRLICLNGSNSWDIARYPFTWDEAAGTFTFCYDEQIPTNGGRGPQSNYFLTYYMIVRSEKALDALMQQATDSEYSVPLTNTITYPSNGVSSTATVDYTYNPLVKDMTDYDASTRTATFRVVANAAKETLNGGNPMTMTDSYSERLSVDFSTISVVTDPPENASQVTWIYSGNVGTYTIPDATKVTLTYRAVVQGEDDENVEFTNTVTVAGHYATVREQRTLTQSSSGTASNPKVRVFKYEQGNMGRKLAGAVFQLYLATDWDSETGRVTDGTPLTYRIDGTGATSYTRLSDGTYTHDHQAGDFIYFITDETGYATIQLFQNTDGFTLEMDTRYYLREVQAPAGYQLSDINWSFQIATQADYSRYIYFKNDTLTVANAPQQGVEVPVSGVKILNGRDMEAGEFTFVLTPAGQTSGHPGMDSARYTATNGAAAAGESSQFTFPSLTFSVDDYENAQLRDADGGAVFWYVVYEEPGADANIQYSDARFLVRIVLRLTDGSLTVEGPTAYPYDETLLQNDEVNALNPTDRAGTDEAI